MMQNICKKIKVFFKETFESIKSVIHFAKNLSVPVFGLFQSVKTLDKSFKEIETIKNTRKDILMKLNSEKITDMVKRNLWRNEIKEIDKLIEEKRLALFESFIGVFVSIPGVLLFRFLTKLNNIIMPVLITSTIAYFTKRIIDYCKKNVILWETDKKKFIGELALILYKAICTLFVIAHPIEGFVVYVFCLIFIIIKTKGNVEEFKNNYPMSSQVFAIFKSQDAPF